MSKSTADQTRQPAATTAAPGAFLAEGRVLFLLVAAALFVYANALGGHFVFDDTKQIVNNPQLHSWANVLAGFTSDVWAFQGAALNGDVPPPYYRPLFTAYLTAGYQLFSLWEPGWHLLSLLAHAAATVLFFRLARLLCADARAAALAALLFAVHPIHAESVAWATGIPDTLAALFYLPSLIWYVRFRREGGRRLLALSVGAFALSLLCKETAVVLPLVVAAWELLFNETKSAAARRRGAALRSAPFFGVAAVYLLARFAVLGRLSWQHPTMANVSDASLLATVPQVLAGYLRHLVAPFDLSLIYDAPLARGFADARFLVPAALLAGLAVALWALRRRLARVHWFALALLFAPLLPVLNLRVFHQEYLIQDRYLYLPSAGFCLLVALLVVRLARGRAALAAAALLLVAFGASTVWQNRVWADSAALWRRAVAHAPQQWAPRYNLGLALLSEKDYAGARAELRAAAERNPRVAAVHNSLALAEDALGDERAAVAGLERALALDPNLYEARNNLGAIHFRRGRYDAAREQFELALRRDPSATQVRFNLARALAAAGEHAAALPNFEAVVARDPADAEGRYHLGLSYAATGRRADARAHIERALGDERLPQRAAEMRAALEKLKDSSQ
jgi:tetratricopeptide (TPR) repeat protein